MTEENAKEYERVLDRLKAWWAWCITRTFRQQQCVEVSVEMWGGALSERKGKGSGSVSTLVNSCVLERLVLPS